MTEEPSSGVECSHLWLLLSANLLLPLGAYRISPNITPEMTGIASHRLPAISAAIPAIEYDETH